MDSPEIDDTREKVQFFAFMAKRFSFFHLYKKEVKLSYDWELEDKYGRLLAYVSTEKIGLFNDYLIREGYAFVFLKYPYRKDYEFRRNHIRISQLLLPGIRNNENIP